MKYLLIFNIQCDARDYDNYSLGISVSSKECTVDCMPSDLARIIEEKKKEYSNGPQPFAGAKYYTASLLQVMPLE